jgi:Mg-chelatase subunit ChlD
MAGAQCTVETLLPGGALAPMADPRTRAERLGVVVTDTPTFYCGPRRGELTSREWSFLTPLLVYNERGRFLLVGTKGGADVAWMHRDEVLASPQCLKDDRHKTWRKALVVNNILSDAPGRLEFATIPLHSGPGPEHSTHAEANLFEVRFVFKTLRVTRRLEDGTGVSRNYYLLGREDRWHQGNVGRVLEGWVDEDLVIEWNHRLAVEFDKATFARRQPARVFKDAQALLADAADPNRESPPGLVAVEYSNQPWDHDISRFPVLDHGASRVARDGQPREVRYYKVGYVGEVVDRDRKVMRREDVAAADVGSIAAATRMLDILFVIDATRSMQPFFPAVKQAVSQFVQGASWEDRHASPEYRTRFAIAVYRDFSEGDAFFEMVLEPTDNLSSVHRALESIDAFSSSTDADLSEAVYEGLALGMDGMRFRRGSTRALVLLGDHGNRPQTDRFDARDVARRLLAHRVALHAVQVNPEPGAAGHESVLFARQAQSLIEQLGGRGSFQRVSPGISVREATEAIRGRLHSVDERSEQTYSVVQELSAGASRDEIVSRWGVEILNDVIEMLRSDYEMSLDDLDRTGYSQLCLRGWLAESCPVSGERQVFHTVYIERGELTKFTGAIEGVLDSIRDLEDEERAAGVIKRALETYTGDRFRSDEETIEQFLERVHGLPVRSTLLRYSPRQLHDTLSGADGGELLAELRKDLQVAAGYLTAVIGDRRVRMVASPTVDPRLGTRYWEVREEPVSDERRWFYETTSGGESFAWVPFEYFP